MAHIAEKQIHLAENTREAEFVLIFKVRAVAPLEHKHLHGVFARTELVGNVELARHVADLAVADKAVVHPEVKAGIHALKVKIYLPALELFGRDIHLAAVKSRGIGIGNVRRIDREGIVHVRIVGRVIAAVGKGLPACGHRHLFKFRRGIKALRGKVAYLSRRGIVYEVPIAAERKKSPRFGASVTCRGCPGIRIKRNIVCARLFAAYVQDLLRFMKIVIKAHVVFPLLCLEAGGHIPRLLILSHKTIDGKFG